MYLHLGQDTVVSFDEIIGIFDLDTTTVSKISRGYLTKAEKSGKVINVSMDLPKSFVLCRKEDGTENIYLSQISSTTLLKRARETYEF